MTISPDQFNPNDYKGWHTYRSPRSGYHTYKYINKDIRSSSGPYVEGEGIEIHVRPQMELPNYHAGESELFTHDPARVQSIFSSKDTRSQVPTGLALANEDAYPGGSRLMSYDRSLSTHSSKLVSNLRDRGLAIPTNEDNPEAKATNPYGYELDGDSNSVSVNPDLDSPVPAHKVQAAKKMVRSILRPSGSGTTPSSPPSALPLSHDEERKPTTPVPGQLSLF